MTDWDIDNIIAGMPDFEYSDGKEIINRSDIVEKLRNPSISTSFFNLKCLL